MADIKRLTAPCGIDCFNCELLEENLTEAFAEGIAARFGVARDRIACKGCRQADGGQFHLPAGGCATLTCVKARQVTFCCECGEFPCARLAPVADGAARYPHNLKVYNLCRIQRVGLERWAQEAAANRRKYFGQRFAVGKGQGE